MARGEVASYGRLLAPPGLTAKEAW